MWLVVCCTHQTLFRRNNHAQPLRQEIQDSPSALTQPILEICPWWSPQAYPYTTGSPSTIVALVPCSYTTSTHFLPFQTWEMWQSNKSSKTSAEGCKQRANQCVKRMRPTQTIHLQLVYLFEGNGSESTGVCKSFQNKISLNVGKPCEVSVPRACGVLLDCEMAFNWFKCVAIISTVSTVDIKNRLFNCLSAAEYSKVKWRQMVFCFYPGKQGPHSASLSAVPATFTVALKRASQSLCRLQSSYFPLEYFPCGHGTQAKSSFFTP